MTCGRNSFSRCRTAGRALGRLRPFTPGSHTTAPSAGASPCLPRPSRNVITRSPFPWATTPRSGADAAPQARASRNRRSFKEWASLRSKHVADPERDGVAPVREAVSVVHAQEWTAPRPGAQAGPDVVEPAWASFDPARDARAVVEEYEAGLQHSPPHQPVAPLQDRKSVV